MYMRLTRKALSVINVKEYLEVPHELSRCGKQGERIKSQSAGLIWPSFCTRQHTHGIVARISCNGRHYVARTPWRTHRIQSRIDHRIALQTCCPSTPMTLKSNIPAHNPCSSGRRLPSSSSDSPRSKVAQNSNASSQRDEIGVSASFAVGAVASTAVRRFTDFGIIRYGSPRAAHRMFFVGTLYRDGGTWRLYQDFRGHFATAVTPWRRQLIIGGPVLENIGTRVYAG
jgi:hypothetical protein